MPAEDRLTPTQTEILAAMREHGGELVRMSGGFWTYPGCPTKVVGRDVVPERYWTIQSVRALMRLEFVRESDRTERGFLTRVALV